MEVRLSVACFETSLANKVTVTDGADGQLYAGGTTVSGRQCPSGASRCVSKMKLQMELAKPDLVNIRTRSCAVDCIFWVFWGSAINPYVLRNFIIYTQKLGFDT